MTPRAAAVLIALGIAGGGPTAWNDYALTPDMRPRTSGREVSDR